MKLGNGNIQQAHSKAQHGTSVPGSPASTALKATETAQVLQIRERHGIVCCNH